MKVDFFIIGAQKSGTTSLAAHVASHPDVCFCRNKEPHFFSRTRDWEARIDQYHALFDKPEGRLCGEASTSYSFLPKYPETAARIRTYNPDAKLIYMVRNPIERIISHLAHRQLKGRSRRGVEKEVLSNPIYLDRSRYAMQIRPYLEQFRRDQILLLIFEEYVQEPRRVIEDMCWFLGLDPGRLPNERTFRENQSVGKPVMRSGFSRLASVSAFRRLIMFLPKSLKENLRFLTRRRLDEKPSLPDDIRVILWRALGPDLEEFERVLGRSVSVWKKPHDEMTLQSGTEA